MDRHSPTEPHVYDATQAFVPPDIEEADAPRVLAKAKAAGWRSGKLPHPWWRLQYSAIVQARASRDAPVDHDGAESLVDLDAEPRLQRFSALVACMLSSQTKDEVTAAAVRRLVAWGLSPQHVVDTPLPQLEAMLKPVGFYVRKASYLQRTSKILLAKYQGDIPRTAAELMALPGIGPKMAYLALHVAFSAEECAAAGIETHIVVDVHVHRISQRLGWASGKTPEQTREQLESWLPQEHWRQINPMLVGFGQQVCKAKNPACSECPVASVCPHARRSGGAAGVKRARISDAAE